MVIHLKINPQRTSLVAVSGKGVTKVRLRTIVGPKSINTTKEN